MNGRGLPVVAQSGGGTNKVIFNFFGSMLHAVSNPDEQIGDHPCITPRRPHSGTAWPEATDLLGEALLTTSVALGDMDDDGRLDIVAGNKEGVNEIVITTACPNGGAQVHGGSWCFTCPDFMGRSYEASGVSHVSSCTECVTDYEKNKLSSKELCNTDPCLRGPVRRTHPHSPAHAQIVR